MELALNRRAAVPVRDQLVAQLEMQILSGALLAGKRLPSVRALARRLKVHPNTVSAAYRALQHIGHVERRQGSGIFVRALKPRALEEARSLDEMLRIALDAAILRGYSGPDVRAAVVRWLAAAPVERVLVVDVEPEMAELLVKELQPLLTTPVRAITIEALARRPEEAAASLIVAHRYHVGRLSRLLPGAPIEPLNIQFPQVRDVLARLPEGALVVVVSCSPELLAIGSVLLQSLRGGDITIEARLVSAPRDWKPLAKAADFVLADVLSFPAVRAIAGRRARECQLVAPESVKRVQQSIATIAPIVSLGKA